MNRVLFVIDMLNDFVNHQGKLFCGESSVAIIPNIKTYLDDFREKGNKIYFICDNHEENDVEFKLFPPHCIKSTWGSSIVDELSPIILNGDKIIQKKRYNAFYDTNLERNMLLSGFLPANTVVTLTGVCTSICVMDTCGHLANMGYSVAVPQDCVADFNPDMHRMSLQRMANIYGATII